MTIDEFIAEWGNDRDYVVAHTSGSTGTPKEIRLLKADMKASALATNRRFGITDRSSLFLCLSVDYIAGKMMIVRSLLSGARLVVEKPSNRPLEHYDGEPLSLVAVVPSQALWLAEHPDRLRYVGKMIVGGGEVPETLRRRLAALGVEAYSTYGMTETCSHVALSRLADEKIPYEAIAPTTFSVDDRGCLVIEAPQFSFGRLVTNDVVDLLSATSFFWKGRWDNVINTGGIKVFPEQMERKIGALPYGRYYISSRPSEKWGREVVLYLESSPLTDADRAALDERLRSVLSPYEMPKAVITEERFEETSSGKIIRKRC